MSDIIEGLNAGFNIAIQSTSERELYQNLHPYFDYVLKTPELKAIWDESEREYTKQHWELWKDRPKTDEEADEADARTMKLERFNLYAIGTLIYCRIYFPIEDYKTTDEPDEEQDPVAVILMRGPEYVEYLQKKKIETRIRWGDWATNRYKHWFKDKRSMYESSLRRFHVMMLDALARQKMKVPIKPIIKFDATASTLKINDKLVAITLRNDKPVEHYILEYIFENKEGLTAKSYYTEILTFKFPRDDKNWRTLWRACEALNKKVSEQAGITSFLKFDSGKSGAALINPDYI